jgi:hypothetical protein
MASVDHVSTSELEPLTAHEREIVGIAVQLRASVDAAPIPALVRDGGQALEFVREALEVLGELDPQLLVLVALDALVGAHSSDRGAVRDGPAE